MNSRFPSGSGIRCPLGLEPLFDDYAFVRPEVTVEFGARSTGEPRAIRPVECDAAPFLPDLQFPQARPSVMLAERTFDDNLRVFAPEAGIFEDDSERTYAQDVMLQIGRQLVPQNPLGFGNMAALVSVHNTIPNNTLPVSWAAGKANGREWTPLLPRDSLVS